MLTIAVENEQALTRGRAISDVDGPQVAKWFYEELFAKEEVNADSIAYALDSAVGKLRASRVSGAMGAIHTHGGVMTASDPNATR
jgi:hypothetical protein